MHDGAGRAGIEGDARAAAALSEALPCAGLFPLLFSVSHDLGVAVRADFAPMRAARQRLELLARPIVLPVVTEFERSRYAHVRVSGGTSSREAPTLEPTRDRKPVFVRALLHGRRGGRAAAIIRLEYRFDRRGVWQDVNDTALRPEIRVDDLIVERRRDIDAAICDAMVRGIR